MANGMGAAPLIRHTASSRALTHPLRGCNMPSEWAALRVIRRVVGTPQTQRADDPSPRAIAA